MGSTDHYGSSNDKRKDARSFLVCVLTYMELGHEIMGVTDWLGWCVVAGASSRIDPSSSHMQNPQREVRPILFFHPGNQGSPPY
jgi:hypothetical protein